MVAIAAAVGDRAPDAVNWANIGPGTSPQSNADQTLQNFDGTLTLRATITSYVSSGGNSGTLFVFKNGGSSGSVSMAENATLDIAVASTNTIHYQVQKGTAGSGTNVTCTVTVKVVETNAQLDTFTVDVSAAP